MGILNKFKKFREKQVGKKQVATKILDKGKKDKKGKKDAKPKKDAVIKPAAKKLDTGLAYKYLIKPMISEKASLLASQGKYVFVVSPRANKVEVEKAVQKVFNVRVKDVNIINTSGKSVRFGRTYGRTKDWKKAIVTLEPGEKIEIYEGV